MPIVNESANPIVVTGPISAAVEITRDNISVQKVLWYGCTTAGHKARLKDLDGNVMVPLIADAPGSSGVLVYTFDLPLAPLFFKGIVCDDLDSGELLIYWAGRTSIADLRAARLG